MDKITTDKVSNTVKTSLNNAVDKTNTPSAGKVDDDKALLQSNAIENSKTVNDKLIQSVNEKVSVSKSTKTKQIDEKSIEDELGDDGIIHTTEKPTDVTTSLTKSSTMAKVYSGSASSVYPQKKSAKSVSNGIPQEISTSNVLGDLNQREISQNELVKDQSNYMSTNADYGQAYWANTLNNNRIVRNDLVKSQKRNFRPNTERINNYASSQRRNTGTYFGDNVSSYKPNTGVRRPDIQMRKNAQKPNDDNKGIGRFKRGVEQEKKNKISDKIYKNKLKSDKSTKTSASESMTRKLKVEKEVKSSVKNLSEIKDKNGDNVKIKIKMHDDGSLYVQEPDNVPAWTDYKNALEERGKTYRENNPEPPFSDVSSDIESPGHKKWSRGYNEDQELYGDKIASDNEDVQIIKRAIKKAQEAIKEH